MAVSQYHLLLEEGSYVLTEGGLSHLLLEEAPSLADDHSLVLPGVGGGAVSTSPQRRLTKEENSRLDRALALLDGTQEVVRKARTPRKRAEKLQEAAALIALAGKEIEPVQQVLSIDLSGVLATLYALIEGATQFADARLALARSIESAKVQAWALKRRDDDDLLMLLMLTA